MRTVWIILEVFLLLSPEQNKPIRKREHFFSLCHNYFDEKVLIYVLQWCVKLCHLPPSKYNFTNGLHIMYLKWWALPSLLFLLMKYSILIYLLRSRAARKSVRLACVVNYGFYNEQAIDLYWFNAQYFTLFKSPRYTGVDFVFLYRFVCRRRPQSFVHAITVEQLVTFLSFFVEFMNLTFRLPERILVDFRHDFDFQFSIMDFAISWLNMVQLPHSKKQTCVSIKL